MKSASLDGPCPNNPFSDFHVPSEGPCSYCGAGGPEAKKKPPSWDEPCSSNQFSDFHVPAEGPCSYCGAVKS